MSCDYELMTLLLFEEEYPMQPFQWCLPAVQIWCFWFLHDWRYRDFKLVFFLIMSISKLILILLTLGKSKLSLFVLFGQVTVTLLSLGKTYREKQSKRSRFDKNSRTTINDSSAGIKNWFPQSINRLYMFNLLFLSVTRFFWFLP